MRIPDDKVEEVRSVVDIGDVVSDYVTLKKKGANFFGLCPFHEEKTPSFSVNPSRGIYKCFGCGKGGNVFSFLMEVEKLGFVEARGHFDDAAQGHAQGCSDKSSRIIETTALRRSGRLSA